MSAEAKCCNGESEKAAQWRAKLPQRETVGRLCLSDRFRQSAGPGRIANNDIVAASDTLVDEFTLSFVHLPVRNLLGLLEQTLRENGQVLDPDDPIAQ